jgi:hypothetical protein
MAIIKWLTPNGRLLPIRPLHCSFLVPPSSLLSSSPPKTLVCSRISPVSSELSLRLNHSFTIVHCHISSQHHRCSYPPSLSLTSLCCSTRPSLPFNSNRKPISRPLRILRPKESRFSLSASRLRNKIIKCPSHQQVQSRQSAISCISKCVDATRSLLINNVLRPPL